MRRTRLVIADRHPIVLQGLASVFAAQRDFQIVAYCRDGASCLEAIRDLMPDAALLDDSLSDVTASEILAVANAENLSTRLVFFAASVEGDVAAAVAAGTCSAISKHVGPEALLQSLRLVAEGISLVPEPSPRLVPAGKDESGFNSENVLAVLTDREREIMRLVSEGLSNKAIARQLNVSQGTIKVHLHHIFQKLEINNRTTLAALAISQRFGGFGIFAAAILTALDEVRAHEIASDDALVNSGATGDSTVEPWSMANVALDAPTATGKFVDDTAANKFTLFSSQRLNSSGHLIFMMTAAGALTYSLDKADCAVQAIDIGHTLTDIFTMTAADVSTQTVTVNIGGGAEAGGNGFHNFALQTREISDQQFADAASRGDTVARGSDKFQIAGEDGVHGAGGPHYAGPGIDGNGTIHGASDGGRLNGDNAFVYLAEAASSSAESDTIANFKSGSDRINLAAFGDLMFMALSPTAKTVPPHTIAWKYDSATDQVIVYVNHTDRALDIGHSALLKIQLPGVVSVKESDFVHEPAKAAVAVTGAAIDPALAAMTAGHVLTTSAEASVGASVSETAQIIENIWTSRGESFSFYFPQERSSTGATRLASFSKSPEGPKEDGGDHAVTLVSASSAELPHGNATGPVEDHSTIDHGPIHAPTVAVKTSDVAAKPAQGAIDAGAFAVAASTEASQPAEQGATPASAADQGQSQPGVQDAAEQAPALAGQDAEHATPTSAADQGKSQPGVQEASEQAPVLAGQDAEHAKPAKVADQGQSMDDVRDASEQACAVAEQDAEHATPANATDHGQSHASAVGPAVAEEDAEHAMPATADNHGQLQCDLHGASEEGPAVAWQDIEHAKPANADNHGRSQHDLHTEFARLSANSHSESDAAGGNGPALANDGQEVMSIVPELGDSLQFKNEMAASNHSECVDLAEDGHGQTWSAHGHHGAGHYGPADIHDADPAAFSVSECHAADHAVGARYHVMHDLFV